MKSERLFLLMQTVRNCSSSVPLNVRKQP